MGIDEKRGYTSVPGRGLALSSVGLQNQGTPPPSRQASAPAVFPLPFARATDTRRRHLSELYSAIEAAEATISPRYYRQAVTLERDMLCQEFQRAIRAGDPGLPWANLKQHQDDLLAALPGFAERRRVELALADKLDYAASQTIDFMLAAEVRRDVAKMRDCRQGGYSGFDPETGKRQTMWDEKCGKVRLCPDESRAETQRMCDKYIPAIMQWIGERPGRRRAFYCVLTEPNTPPGTLAAEKAGQFERLKSKILKARRPATERDYAGGLSRRRQWVPLLRSIRGALAIQEDPLSARGDWNAHLNVILLVDGAFSFAELREQWGHNLHIAPLDVDVKAITSTFLEIIKYSAQFTASKSDSKKARGLSDAPGMLNWPPGLLLEWYAAQKGFRRSRSYGCLYRLPEPPEPLEYGPQTRWVTRVQYCDAGHYIVSLILENNFFNNGALCNKAAPSTGPPGPGVGKSE